MIVPCILGSEDEAVGEEEVESAAVSKAEERKREFIMTVPCRSRIAEKGQGGTEPPDCEFLGEGETGNLERQGRKEQIAEFDCTTRKVFSFPERLIVPTDPFL